MRSATGWLLDRCPPEYRAYDVLRRHPLVLARFTAWHVAGCAEAARRGLAGVRTDLAGVVPVEAVAAALSAFERESARLAGTAREVGLVEAALRGQRHAPRL